MWILEKQEGCPSGGGNPIRGSKAVRVFSGRGAGESIIVKEDLNFQKGGRGTLLGR